MPNQLKEKSIKLAALAYEYDIICLTNSNTISDQNIIDSSLDMSEIYIDGVIIAKTNFMCDWIE